MPALIPALLRMRCPVCRKGHVFKNANPYRLKTVGDIYSLCPVCGQNFRPEPGFYFGGAIISYPLMVVYGALVTGLFYLVVGDISDHFVSLMITLSVAVLLITPVTFRYSRILFLYFCFKYRGS
jgi:hypothetical protein